MADQPSPVWRISDPLEPVWVDLTKVYEYVPGPPPQGTPSALVRNHGLVFRGLVPGELYAWARTIHGSWLGLVVYDAPTPQLGYVQVRHYVAREALQKRRTGETEPPF